MLLPDHDVVPVTCAIEALARLAADERFDAIVCDCASTDEARTFLSSLGCAYIVQPSTSRASEPKVSV